MCLSSTCIEHPRRIDPAVQLGLPVGNLPKPHMSSLVLFLDQTLLTSMQFLTDPSQSEVMGDPHIMTEHQLGLKFLWTVDSTYYFSYFNKTCRSVHVYVPLPMRRRFRKLSVCYVDCYTDFKNCCWVFSMLMQTNQNPERRYTLGMCLRNN